MHRAEPAAAPRPLEGRAAWALLFVGFFTITYFETVAVGGLKFAVVWRALFVVPALLLIALATRPAGADALKPLLWAWAAFTLAPLASVVIGVKDPGTSIELVAQRAFPVVVVLAVYTSRRYDIGDLVLRAFPFFLCAVSLPLLTGLLPPTGLQFSLEAVTGVALTAYNGVFQNQHSAALAHGIAAICAFTLAARFPGRRSVPYLLVALGCLALTLMTTARSGLIALLIGLTAIAVLKQQLRLLVVPAAILTAAALIAGIAKPQLVELAVNRLLGKTLYTVDYGADALTSGRLTLQAAALTAYANQPPAAQVFGIGKEASKEAIDRYSGHYLISHNAFVDELISYGALGLAALIASLFAAARLAWRNARLGHPGGFALLLAVGVFALLQGIDYSLHLAIVGLVLLLETRAAGIGLRRRATERAARAGPTRRLPPSTRLPIRSPA